MLEKLEKILENRVKHYRDLIQEADQTKEAYKIYLIAKQEECLEILEIVRRLKHERQ